MLSNSRLSKRHDFKSFEMPLFDENNISEPKERIEAKSEFDTGFINLDVLMKSALKSKSDIEDGDKPQEHDGIVRPFTMKTFKISELLGPSKVIDHYEEDVEINHAAEIDAKMIEAFELGHKEGFEKGKGEGFEAGRLEGLTLGKIEGFESAKKDGFLSGTKSADSLLEGFSALIKEIAGLEDKIVSDLEPKVLELSFAIAKRILFEELRVYPETIIRLTREALKKISKTGKVVIKINPKLHDLFMEKKADLLSLHADIVIDVDPSLPKTGFLVTGPENEISINIEKMVNEMKEEIAG